MLNLTKLSKNNLVRITKYVSITQRECNHDLELSALSNNYFKKKMELISDLGMASSIQEES